MVLVGKMQESIGTGIGREIGGRGSERESRRERRLERERERNSGRMVRETREEQGREGGGVEGKE